MKYAVLRDTRLAGTFPAALTARSDVTFVTVNDTTTLSSKLVTLGTTARADPTPAKTLFILCHGYAGESERLASCGDFGGQGLQLGRESVMHGNVSMFTALAGAFQNIIIYACAAGNTESGNEGTTEDGRYLMGAIAIHANANVYAADRIQWYQQTGFDFGVWEGRLLKFLPTGQPPTTVSAPPVELGHLPAA